MGSGFTGYLVTTYEKLVERLGMSNDCTKDSNGKVRVEWAFKTTHNKPTVITVYDYKETIPVDKVMLWHVGSRGDMSRVERFFKERGCDDLKRSR